MKNISIDIETFSSVDLGKCGVYKYAESPDFEILLFGYSVDGSPVQVVDLASGERIPDEILAALMDPAVRKWAFNAQFERICLSRYLSDLGVAIGAGNVYLNPDSWFCSMVWSATLGLPLSLEGVGAVLGLEKQKLTEGKSLIRYFCIPCSPTKANGGRTRNRSVDDPEKWKKFKAYNLRDVETEMGIQAKLSRFPVSCSIWTEYHLDQTINDRGVMIDMDLVNAALKLDNQSRQKLVQEMCSLTSLENPNSVQQLKGWLAEKGFEVESLGKKKVQKMLEDCPEEIGKVLGLRLQLAKSSVKKYQAMKNYACQDHRMRGLFQFYGAGRTGRFSSRGVQLQNLKRNELSNIDVARTLTKEMNGKAIELLFDSVPEVLSQLVRTALIPKPGMKFIVSDFSAIEARVLSWLAGEEWRMETFVSGGDIYCATASRMFHCNIVKHGENGELRQKGKQAELACIAEGELVLTDQGLIPIEKVTLDQKVWDGENWVGHEGVVCNGEGSVIEYEGLRATADHYVWVEGKPEPVRFGKAASSSSHLIQTGDGGNPVRLGENNQPREKMEQELESLLCSDTVSGMWEHSMAELNQSSKRKVERMSELLTTKEDPILVGKKADSCQTEMHKPQRSGIHELWRTRNRIQISDYLRSGFVSDESLSKHGQKIGTGSNRYKWSLRTWKFEDGLPKNKSSKPKEYGFKRISTGVLALQSKCCRSNAQSGIKQRSDRSKSGTCSSGTQKELETHLSKTRLYDIKNAGPNHRFTVSGKLVHNCGYGGAAGALKAMGALEMGLSEEELKPLVDAWREANPKIVQLWWEVDRCVKETVKYRVPTKTHGIRFSYESGFLFITLPSGRRLAYVKPRIGKNQFGSESVTYEGVGGTKKWERLESYGPKFVENITQAIARDILMYSMKTLEGYAITAHVHDELIIECPKETDLDYICKQMGKTPPWADGLVLRADGYECEFYKKD